MKTKARNTTAGLTIENVLDAVLRALTFKFDRQVCASDASIYGYKLFADFVIWNLPAFPRGLAVESKWQEGRGSIDEKFPYLADNICRCYRFPAVVVVHGGGCRPGALQYLRARCDGSHLVDVYTLEEFIAWAIRTNKSGLS